MKQIHSIRLTRYLGKSSIKVYAQTEEAANALEAAVGKAIYRKTSESTDPDKKGKPVLYYRPETVQDLNHFAAKLWAIDQGEGGMVDAIAQALDAPAPVSEA